MTQNRNRQEQCFFVRYIRVGDMMGVRYTSLETDPSGMSPNVSHRGHRISVSFLTKSSTKPRRQFLMHVVAAIAHHRQLLGTPNVTF